MLKIKDIPDGSIIWIDFKVLGIKGIFLREDYLERECKPVWKVGLKDGLLEVSGNVRDYDLVNVTQEDLDYLEELEDETE